MNNLIKTYSLFFLMCLPIFIAGTCGPNPKPIKTVKEKIQKSWRAKSVSYNNNIVYAQESATNIVNGYSNYRLDLSNSTTVSLTEFDGNIFTGTWSLNSNETKLTLSNLIPEPTLTNGTLVYNINNSQEEELTITLETYTKKTGNITIDYVLIPN